MPIGPGKYDLECEAAFMSTKARCVLLLVLDGRKGSGFSMTADVGIIHAVDVPNILRSIANEIESSIKEDDHARNKA